MYTVCTHIHMAYALVSWEAVRHMLHYVGVACEDGFVTLGLAHGAYLNCARCFIPNTQLGTSFLNVLEDRIKKKKYD